MVVVSTTFCKTFWINQSSRGEH
ncbi:unnamed protein product [Nezara viridula]|uniref:Uncharacterized protein n=1 Tax=Nezara viridula TaxID=85310 RepID=A0A9P0H2P2_NEZVI|nr:unnamed protein product [Nezara viridula]